MIDRVVRVQVSNPALVPDLLDFLRRATCDVTRAGSTTIAVDVPSAKGAREARKDLDLFLTAWQALHPPVEARRIVEGEAPVPAAK